MESWRRGIVPAWSALLAIAVGLPWFRGGYLLSYDMVWVPHLDLDRADLWGLGSALPRAVPSDAVVAVLGAVVDPAVVQRAVLLLALVAAGVGAGRLVAGLGLLPQLVAATFALWNPYVAERLVMGHWPLLIGYAALFWLVDGVQHERWGAVAVALVATSLTPVNGLMGLVVLVVVSRRFVLPVVAATVVNAPWIVASLVNRGAVAPDSGGIEAFAIQPEGPLGRVGAALSLGGIWNTEAVPTSRDLPIATVITALLWLVAVVGAVRMRRSRTTGSGALLVLGVVGLLLSTVGWWAGGVMEAAVEVLGPVALLRDGTRWLALLAVPLVVALAHGTRALLDRWDGTGLQAVPLLVVLLPVAALPDLALGVDGRVTPVTYPADWDRARAAVSSVDVPGDLLALPFTIYRQPGWNEGRKVLDPAGRYFDRTTLTDDRLEVGDSEVAGEDPRAVEVRALLADGARPGELAAAGIGVVVVDVSAPGGTEALASVEDLEPVLVDGDLRVFSDPGAVRIEPSTARRVVLAATWIAWAVVLVASLVAPWWRGRPKGRHDAPRA